MSTARNANRHIGSLMGAASLIALCLPTAAIAQDAEDPSVMDTVTITGFRQSFANSLELKRNADQIIDAISAEEIGQFPDQNVSEAVQRISGVQITRANGEGEQVNIRGLAANFTRIEVDGRSASITIDSADPGRGSTLSVLSSDLYNTIEVIKSPTASDVEGGVGGIVKLKTPSPLDIGKLRWGVEAGSSFSEIKDDAEPTFSGHYSNVYMDGRLGFLVSGTLENKDLSLDKIQNNDNMWSIDSRSNGGTDPAFADFENALFAGRFRQEERAGDSQKLNLNAKLEFLATDALKIYANTLYTTQESERTTSRLQIAFRRGRPALLSDLYASATEPVVVDNGTVLQGAFSGSRVEPRTFFRDTTVETMGIAGGFNWNYDDWSIDGELNHQSSEEEFSETRVGARFNALAGFSLLNDVEYPEITIEDGAFDLADIEVRDLDQQQRVIKISETSAKLDAMKQLELGFIKSIKSGFRFASTEFDRKQGLVESPRAGDGLSFSEGTALLGQGEFADGFGGNLLRAWPSIDPVAMYSAYPSETPFTFNDENLYTFTEDTLAGYLQANYEADLGLFARGNFGVRVIQTRYDGEGAVDLAGDDFEDLGNVGVRQLERDYTDVLPSLNVILSKDSDSDFIVRAAVARVMTRPEISQIQPGLVVRINNAVELDDQDNTFERGNPELDPFRAWQYDLGFEWYFGDTGEAAISGALFYKDVENFVTTTQGAISFSDPENGLADTYTLYNSNYAINGGEASIQGFEIGAQTPLSFLPAPFDNFGVYGNYTYTDSEFTDVQGNTQPFPGSSENAFNLVGYYEQGPFSARLAYNYRDGYLDVVSGELDDNDQPINNVFGDTQGRVDASIRLRFENGLRASFDALNLTEEQSYKYYDQSNHLEDLEVEGRIFAIGLGYSF